MEEGEATGSNNERTTSYHHLQTSRGTQQPNNNDIFSGGDGKNYPMSEPASQTAPAPAPAPGSTRSSTNGSGSEYRVVHCPKITANPPASTGPFCSNVVVTSKYTIWSFLPKFLIESFKKLANAYFLLVSILQCVPKITQTGGLPTNLPVLMFILAVDGILAIIEDRRRHKADDEANSASCHIVTSTFTGNISKIQPTSDPDVSVIQWSELTVGTIVKLRNRETAPADLIVLAVDEPDPDDPNGICYVETKSLDGETNLKLRSACEGTVHYLIGSKISQLKGYLRCENPNKVIGRFDGTLYVHDTQDIMTNYPISIKNVILRGCQLRNTEWIFGLVVNTGPDTKIMQSAAKPRAKWSSINETVNKMIVWLFLFLCILCFIASSAQIGWYKQNEEDSIYLYWFPNLIAQWFIGFGNYFLLMYQMIPVSLYVTISTVMFIQSIFMTWDLDMYYEELDVRMIVRSMGLNEELGQISYVFSDKTGTLTCNVMEFRKCSINGISYGTGTTEIGRAALRRKGLLAANDFSNEETESKNSAGKKKVAFVNFHDPKMAAALNGPTSTISKEAEFFLHLGLCHTVIPEAPIEGSTEVRFSASSPDEQALVSGAKYFGFAFESRGLGIARVRISNRAMLLNKNNENELWEFKILDVLEFNSERKRMSVVVQYPTGEYYLLTKGADNMIYPLLSKKENEIQKVDDTLQHLEIFGDDGLRTLTIAKKKLDEKIYLQWSQQYKEANSSLEEIEKRKQGQPNEIDRLMEELEQDLILLGATAIEDKLQKNVPRAIANLMLAGMKVWMLTGDKQETAINISYACQLMDNDMQQFIFNCDLFPTKENLLRNLQQVTEAMKTNGRKAVVIDGECLEVTLDDPITSEMFLKIALGCDAVVCCRVSPSQKAEVVGLVRASNKKARTLSIGDGANDVAMIQRAHVGVGICGQEGMQAVNSSDYAIGQFAYLEKLLLHHGRLNYKRMSIVVGYMFYKNIIMVLGQYYYMYLTGVSGQKFYSEFAFQLYNICYTSLPIIVLGVFDYDVPWSTSKNFPQLYLVGPRMELFNVVTFFKWIASAIYEALVIFFFCIWGYNPEYYAAGSGAMVQYGLITFTLVVLIANLKLFMIQMSWSVYGGLLWWIGVLSYIPVSIYLSSNLIRFFSVDYGSFQNTLNGATYWFVLPIACVVALLRHFAWTAIHRRFYPSPWHIVQEQHVLGTNTAGDVTTSPGAGYAIQNPIDMEGGASASANGSIQVDSEIQFVATETPPAGASDDSQKSHRTRPSETGSASSEPKPRTHRQASSFAFSYDPETAMAEAYISTHSVASAASAISDAESRGRVSREDSRASDFGATPREKEEEEEEAAAAIRPSSPGLFV